MGIESKIGFMQGRLSEIKDGKIQSFPWDSWEQEFEIARSIKFRKIEWTLDQFNLRKNPINDFSYHSLIKKLCIKNKIEIQSLTGDCFMEFPFWKFDGEREQKLKKDFDLILNSCAALGIKIIVIPLVDNGRIESNLQEKKLVDFCLEKINFLKNKKIKIAFESDFCPTKLSAFISLFPHLNFGVNYDIGNSASLGFDPQEEFDLYGKRIINVHVKDRIKNGNTVPLGHGDADFPLIFKLLFKVSYSGNFIIQGARCSNNDHSGILEKYFKYVYKLIEDNFI